MGSSSSVIAAPYDFKIQRNAGFDFYFQFQDADAVSIDLSTAIEIKIEVRNTSGAVMCSFEIGDGLSISSTDNTILIMTKGESEKNIAPGNYVWDVKIALQDEEAQYPLRGSYQVVNYITE